MVTLADVLRRYVYFIEEKDIEYDIQQPENLNQFYLINNYSAEVPEVLKEVSIKKNYRLVLGHKWNKHSYSPGTKTLYIMM